ncbi:MAG TPA: hypothetical protein VGO86_08075, partial [Candidatus Dormibacteraeota bacterium]
MAAALTQPVARTANGRVYYLDATGRVRSLSPDGAVSDVITLPFSSQISQAGRSDQELAFAVSPDGRQLIASVLTLPRTTSVDPERLSAVRDPNGHWFVDLFSAVVGGTVQRLSHQDLGT